MKIAIFNLDSLVTNDSMTAFIERHREDVAFVGLSDPFRASQGGVFGQARRMMGHALMLGSFMFINVTLPRLAFALNGLFPGLRRPVAHTCRNLNIPVRNIDDVNDPEIQSLLRSAGVDLIVSCYFDQFFNDETIAAARLGGINVHTSMLPENRGPMPVMFSRLKDSPNVGVTVHRIQPKIDTGEILAQQACPVSMTTTVMSATKTLHGLGLGMVDTLVAGSDFDSSTGLPQGEGSYEGFPKAVDFRMARARGLSMWNLSDVRDALFKA